MGYRGYLETETPQDAFAYLLKHRYTRKLNVAKDRTMAKGWERRVVIQEGKLHREEKYRAALKDEGLEA